MSMRNMLIQCLKMYDFLPHLMRVRGLGVHWYNSTLCHMLFTYCLHLVVLCVGASTLILLQFIFMILVLKQL